MDAFWLQGNLRKIHLSVANVNVTLENIDDVFELVIVPFMPTRREEKR